MILYVPYVSPIEWLDIDAAGVEHLQVLVGDHVHYTLFVAHPGHSAVT